MAEIRKFTEGKGGQIRQALIEAMGEGVRPATPGAGDKPAPKPKSPASGPTATSGVIWDPFLKTAPAKALKRTAQGTTAAAASALLGVPGPVEAVQAVDGEADGDDAE
ncbi:hypothetical protein ACPCG0_14385 [Propionibacteriaceae bacterium Y1923]|uniref:hypothetical protein n=1 Tax=Aestuariimicrobium sp. Y1814 TaxID=3418742 RepID=UPI003C2812FD